MLNQRVLGLSMLTLNMYSTAIIYSTQANSPKLSGWQQVTSPLFNVMDFDVIPRTDYSTLQQRKNTSIRATVTSYSLQSFHLFITQFPIHSHQSH